MSQECCRKPAFRTRDYRPALGLLHGRCVVAARVVSNFNDSRSARRVDADSRVRVEPAKA
jgi:hypothetical protein